VINLKANAEALERFMDYINKKPHIRDSFLKYLPNFLSVHSAPNVRKRQKQGGSKREHRICNRNQNRSRAFNKKYVECFQRVCFTCASVCVGLFAFLYMCVTVVDNWHNKEEETAMAATK